MMSRLLNSLKQEIRRRNYSYKTEKAYTLWAKRLVRLCKMKHPLEVDQQQIVHFLNYLANERNVASSTQNQALCALVFLYREDLKQQMGVLETFKTSKRYHPVTVGLYETELNKY